MGLVLTLLFCSFWTEAQTDTIFFDRFGDTALVQDQRFSYWTSIETFYEDEEEGKHNTLSYDFSQHLCSNNQQVVEHHLESDLKSGTVKKFSSKGKLIFYNSRETRRRLLYLLPEWKTAPARGNQSRKPCGCLLL